MNSKRPEITMPTYFTIRPTLHVGLTEAGADISRRTAMDPNLFFQITKICIFFRDIFPFNKISLPGARAISHGGRRVDQGTVVRVPGSFCSEVGVPPHALSHFDQECLDVGVPQQIPAGQSSLTRLFVVEQDFDGVFAHVVEIDGAVGHLLEVVVVRLRSDSHFDVDDFAVNVPNFVANQPTSKEEEDE